MPCVLHVRSQSSAVSWGTLVRSPPLLHPEGLPVGYTLLILSGGCRENGRFPSSLANDFWFYVLPHGFGRSPRWTYIYNFCALRVHGCSTWSKHPVEVQFLHSARPPDLHPVCWQWSCTVCDCSGFLSIFLKWLILLNRTCSKQLSSSCCQMYWGRGACCSLWIQDLGEHRSCQERVFVLKRLRKWYCLLQSCLCQ